MAPRTSPAVPALAAGLAGLAAFGSSSAFVGPNSVVGSAAPAKGAIQQSSTVADSTSSAFPSQAAGAAAALITAGFVTRFSLAGRQDKLSLRSLGMGEEGRGSGTGYYNLLPEWEKPASGFEGTIGDQEPLGFWDPAGFTADGNVEKFKKRREVELKHGRVAMFATIGYIVPEYFKFPGYCSTSLNLKFADIPNGLKALAVVPKEGWAQIVAFAGFLELVVNKPTGEPGNYSKGFLGLGYLGLGTSVQNPDARAKKLRAELSNGRLAMFAIIGMFFQDGLTGSAWGDWSLYTDSPLRAFENETGAQPPVGFWDPLGLAASGSNFDFKRRREVELKHGRVAMFATIGYILPEYWRFPGDLSTYNGIKFTDVPNGLAAISKVPYLGWLQIVGFAGLIEVNVYNENVNGEPGNYGAGFLGLRTVGIMNTGFKDADVRKKKLNAELANGRLAMMAIIGMFFQDGLTGSAWGDWANYTDSPLRAFEGELGVQAPVGFWDPVGYCRDGNVETFKRRRETEIKHGRVAMYATIGYITPEYFKWPGYLSPSLGLKFEDVPNGLAAFSKVPGNGWAQIVAFAGYYELFVYKYSGTPGAYGWKVITSSDPEGLKRKLNAELANGRLAMMAIIGMFFQDGLTGSAWGDWSLYTDSPLRSLGMGEEGRGSGQTAGTWREPAVGRLQRSVAQESGPDVVFQHGKHQGRTFADVLRTDSSYFAWARRQEDVSIELKAFIDFGNSAEGQAQAPTCAMKDGKRVFQFGRYSGRTFGDVLGSEPGYFRWASQLPDPSYELRDFVDYASRVSGTERPNLQDPEEDGPVFTFGKYRGRSYASIARSVPGYVAWARKAVDQDGSPKLMEFLSFVDSIEVD